MSCIVFILLGLAVCGFTHALFNHIGATGAAVVSITDAFVAAVTGAIGLLAARQQMLTIRAGACNGRPV